MIIQQTNIIFYVILEKNSRFLPPYSKPFTWIMKISRWFWCQNKRQMVHFGSQLWWWTSKLLPLIAGINYISDTHFSNFKTQDWDFHWKQWRFEEKKFKNPAPDSSEKVFITLVLKLIIRVITRKNLLLYLFPKRAWSWMIVCSSCKLNFPLLMSGLR